jgi:hypothetical protein
MRAHLTRIFLPYQKNIHNIILGEVERIAGKLGEFEGVVIKIKRKPEDFIFKVISPSFHK